VTWLSLLLRTHKHINSNYRSLLQKRHIKETIFCVNEPCHTSEYATTHTHTHNTHTHAHSHRHTRVRFRSVTRVILLHTHTHTHTNTHTHIEEKYGTFCYTRACVFSLSLSPCPSLSFSLSDSFCLILNGNVTQSDCGRDSFWGVTWPILKCDMTHSIEWHDSVCMVAWLFLNGDMAQSGWLRDSFWRVTRFLLKCHMTYSEW